MAVIDLDREVRPTSSRTPGQRVRVLVALMASALVFGLTGEPHGSPNPRDEATFCPMIAVLDGAAGADFAVIDPRTGKVLHTVHCRA